MAPATPSANGEVMTYKTRSRLLAALLGWEQLFLFADIYFGSDKFYGKFSIEQLATVKSAL